jgi:hypothetical protein
LCLFHAIEGYPQVLQGVFFDNGAEYGQSRRALASGDSGAARFSFAAFSCGAQRSAPLAGDTLEAAGLWPRAQGRQRLAQAKHHICFDDYSWQFLSSFFVRAGLDQRGRFSNTSFAIGIAENTVGQPT